MQLMQHMALIRVLSILLSIHAWRNVSSTNYARMVYVLIGAKEVKIDGKPLEAVTIH